MCSTLLWLGRALLAVLAVIGLPQFAQADFINLISQSYHIQGAGTGIVAYDVTSAVPITREEIGKHYDPITGLQDGQAEVFTHTDGGVATQSAFVQASVATLEVSQPFVMTVGPATASAAITFRPLVSDVVVNTIALYGFPFIAGSAQLYDETIGAAVFAQGSNTMPMTYNVILDLSHLYTLSVLSSVGGSTGGEPFAVQSTIAPAPVPESETTLTFLVVGLGALLLVARAQTTFRLSS
jgi:hypothetical protein